MTRWYSRRVRSPDGRPLRASRIRSALANSSRAQASLWWTRADAETSGSSTSNNAAPSRKARVLRVRVVEAWVFTKLPAENPAAMNPTVILSEAKDDNSQVTAFPLPRETQL